MSLSFSSYCLHKIETPTGRTIGDNSCAYDSLEVICVCLETADGLIGWGYGETCSKGWFEKSAFWIQPMALLDQIQTLFESYVWPSLRNTCLDRALTVLESIRRHLPSYLNAALILAVWDLLAQERGLPLWKYIGGRSAGDQVTAYGSLLDFPLSESEAIDKACEFVQRGFRTIKVKVGAEDVARDIERLSAIRASIPEIVKLSADANTAWTAEETIRNLKAFALNGIELSYIEDPIPCSDISGFEVLANARRDNEIITPIAAHDYAETVVELELLMQTGALTYLRNGKDINHSIQVARIAKEHGIKMIFGNSMFEANAHLACAFEGSTSLLEFSDLKWNELLICPIGFKDGRPQMPSTSGHGLVPDPEMLKAWKA